MQLKKLTENTRENKWKNEDGGKVIKLRTKSGNQDLVSIARVTSTSPSLTVIKLQLRKKERSIKQLYASIRRNKKDGGCRFYHNALRT